MILKSSPHWIRLHGVVANIFFPVTCNMYCNNKILGFILTTFHLFQSFINSYIFFSKDDICLFSLEVVICSVEKKCEISKNLSYYRNCSLCLNLNRPKL